MNSKLLGSTLIIAGTTIGAGMLGLPLASAGMGFSMSVLLMLALWVLMTFTALLMLELHQYADSSATLHTLAAQILGTKGKWVTSAAMLFLFYSLCAAYIAGGGGQFAERLSQWFHLSLSPACATIIFTIIVAFIITVGTTAVDRVNRVLFSLKICAMAVVLFFLAPRVSESYLLNLPLNQGLVVAALPVIFTSFGFHGSIPAVVKYLNGDTRLLRKAVVIGSCIPLAIYVLWQWVTLGNVSQQVLMNDAGLGHMIGELSSVSPHPQLKTLVGVFADLALLTSFLGVGLGLFEFIGDSIKITRGAQRVIPALVTFIPPLAFALFYPQGFITALGYAAIALAILAVFLPVAMVSKVRKSADTKGKYRVAGGRTALVVSLGCASLIIVVQVLVTLGQLPSLG